MCNAVAATMGLEVAGGLNAAAGEKEKAAANANYYNYLAKQNDIEADVTAKRADVTVTGIYDQAFEEEKDRAADVRKLEGRQKTVLAANGIYGGSKTAENIAFDTLNSDEKDAAALRYNANVKAYETKVSANDRVRALKSQATTYRYSAETGITAGDTNATSTLLGTAGNVADSWMRWNRTSKGN